MKRLVETKPDVWAGRREASFAANKSLADKLAHQRGGKCLSGPQRKCDKWLWKCGVSDHKAWKATLYQIEGYKGRKGTWCRLCSASGWAKRRKARFAANKQLADTLARKRGGRCLSGPRRKHDKWGWKCSNAEHSVWQATLWQIQGTGKKAGSWCPQCVGRNVPRKVYQAWAKRFGGRIIKHARRTTDDSIWWCKLHDEFPRSLSSMQTTDSFCPTCNASLGERKCKAAMEQLFGKCFVKQRFPNLKGVGGKPLEIDLYNEELRLGLEHQGAQHFIKKKFFGEHRYAQVREHDRRKRVYCARNGITLIEIRQVGEKTPDHKLKDAIREQLNKKKFPLPPNFEQITVSFDTAALPSLQEDKWEETKAEAAKRGWTVVSDKYLGCLTIHHFVCDQGHRVEIEPSRLLWGDGCWRCEEKPAVFDDGRLFESITKAAKAVGRSVSAVSTAILTHGRVRGKRVATTTHRELAALHKMNATERAAAIRAMFDALPVKPKVGEANGKPVLLGDGRMFSSAYEAARAVGADEKNALSAAKRPKGKIKGMRIAQITNEQREAFQKKPSLIAGFWEQRPLGPRKFMTRRRGVLTSLKEVFDGVRETSLALGVSEQQVCDYARREKELKGRSLWYLSQEELALLRDRKIKPAQLLERKKIHGHAPPTFNKRKDKKP